MQGTIKNIKFDDCCVYFDSLMNLGYSITDYVSFFGLLNARTSNLINVELDCDVIVQKKFNRKQEEYSSKNDLLRTGIIVSIGLAIHNFPEGLAIGSGFGASLKLRIFTCNNNCDT